MRKHFLALAAIILFFASAAGQQRIFVSTSGSDSASGSVTQPLNSVGCALEKARKLPGTDTVFIHFAPGTYFLEEPITLTPADRRPMVFEGDPENLPVLSGGYRIDGWEVTPEGRWKTRVPEVARYGQVFQQLFVNGERATLARTPDKGLFDVIGQVYQTPVETEGKDAGYGYYIQRYATDPGNLASMKNVNDGVWSDSNLKENDMRILLFQAWDNTYKNVDYVNPDSGFVYLHGTKLHDMYSRHNRFRLENYKGALNSPGEWFLDRLGLLTYIPREGEDPSTAQVFAPGLKNLIVVKGNENNPVTGKVFRNLSFQHTAYLSSSRGTTPYQAASHLDGTVNLEYAEGITLENCEIKHTGNYAVFCDHASGCKVEHTFMYDLGGGGFKIDNSQGIQVLNSIIRKGGQVFPSGVGVLIRESSGTKVLHNEICDLRYSGVSVGWVWGYGKSLSFENEIGWNHIHHLGWGELDDMGGVYTLGIQPGTTVHDNVIHDVYSHDYGGWGLYTDEGSTGIVMENNLVYACKCGGFHQHYGKDNVIRNNILAWSTWQQLQWTRVEDHRSFTFERNIILSDGFPLLGDQKAWKEGKADFDRNCFWDITESYPKFNGMTLEEFRKLRDPRTIVADPMFKDPLHGDFTFKSLKTARKIGFKPFDYSKAGVEGDAAWKEKARMAQEDLDEFVRVVRAGDAAYPRYYKD
ncbi:MAG: right-handed parallel beta-helix repeat-containing protein [Bacteroidales bacterium]|nr:right-handed parallel beta-helix repeat-containing protein [Bacteroidales bacterium]